MLSHDVMIKYGWNLMTLKILGFPHFIYIIIQMNTFMMFINGMLYSGVIYTHQLLCGSSIQRCYKYLCYTINLLYSSAVT